MSNKYDYQIQAANQVLKDALSLDFEASVLAVAPGGGKTTISHHIINRYLEIFPSARILVLTEGQNALKNQYLRELSNPNVSINFTFGDFQSDAQVRVGIPQSATQLDWDSIDLLIVDEAHNFYLEPMVQDIVNSLLPSHKVLMTGSPTKYNALNATSTRYAMYYISAEELQAMGVYSAVDVDIVKSSGGPACKMNQILIDAETKGDSLEKLMIACSTIEDAEAVTSFLKSIGRSPAMSTSKNDPDSILIDDFRKGEYDALVVVGKGILGFNDPNITLLADLRSSNNIDASFQLFARVLRKHPKSLRKSYYRVSGSSKAQYSKEVITCQKMLALMQRDVYTQYNGKNLSIEVV